MYTGIFAKYYWKRTEMWDFLKPRKSRRGSRFEKTNEQKDLPLMRGMSRQVEFTSSIIVFLVSCIID